MRCGAQSLQAFIEVAGHEDSGRHARDAEQGLDRLDRLGFPQTLNGCCQATDCQGLGKAEVGNSYQDKEEIQRHCSGDPGEAHFECGTHARDDKKGKKTGQVVGLCMQHAERQASHAGYNDESDINLGGQR